MIDYWCLVINYSGQHGKIKEWREKQKKKLKA